MAAGSMSGLGRARYHLRNNGSKFDSMKSALILIASVACTWAATDSGALVEANAGLGLAREGKYEQAIPHYRAAIKLDPHLSGIYLNLGLAYLKLERFPEAATAFEQAAKSDPSSFPVHVLLGMSYYGCRRFDAAAVQLKRAAAQQPENEELRFKLAQSYL